MNPSPKYDFSNEFCDFLYIAATKCYKYFKKSVGQFYKPKKKKIPLFEFLVYLSVRLDLAIYKEELPENVGQYIFEKIWAKMDKDLYNLHDNNISEYFNGRMSQYARIFRNHKDADRWKELHGYWAELLKRAEVEEKLFCGQWKQFPIVIGGITKDFLIKATLLDIERIYIIPYDKTCNIMIKKLNDLLSDQ